MASLEFGVKRLQANGVCVCVWTWGLVSMPNGHKETKKSCFWWKTAVNLKCFIDSTLISNHESHGILKKVLFIYSSLRGEQQKLK